MKPRLVSPVQWSKASRVTPIIMVTLVVLTTEKPSTVLALGVYYKLMLILRIRHFSPKTESRSVGQSIIA